MKEKLVQLLSSQANDVREVSYEAKHPLLLIFTKNAMLYENWHVYRDVQVV